MAHFCGTAKNSTISEVGNQQKKPLSRPCTLFSLKSGLPAGRPNLKQDQGSERGRVHATHTPRHGTPSQPKSTHKPSASKRQPPTQDGDLSRLPPPSRHVRGHGGSLALPQPAKAHGATRASPSRSSPAAAPALLPPPAGGGGAGKAAEAGASPGPGSAPGRGKHLRPSPA